MDFGADIQNYIRGEFEFFNISYSSSGEMDKDLLRLFTIQEKYIRPIPRSTEISKELQQKLSTTLLNDAPEIWRLKLMIEKGIDVNPHQSKNLLNYQVHDKLVYDWKIYHLHLSSSIEERKYFTKRTANVLFVYIDHKQALLLDVLNHKQHEVFADKKLLEIVDNNRPDLLLEMTDVVGLSHDRTAKQRFQLRKHNVNEGGLEVNGKFVFAPGLGLTSSGVAVQSAMNLNQLLNWYKRNEEVLMLYKKPVDEYFKHMHKLELEPDFKIVFSRKGPQIIDKKTGHCLINFPNELNKQYFMSTSER